MSSTWLVRSMSVGLSGACALASNSGCLSQSYEISAPELERIVELPVEERGDRLRVTQQTSIDGDVNEVQVARLWTETDWAIVFAGGHHGHYGYHDHPGRGRRGRFLDALSKDDDDAGAEEALAAAVVVVAVAATAAVTVGITEGARFDGWVRAPVEHPLLLVDDSGRGRWARLETLTADDLRGVDRAVLPDFAHDLRHLARHRLDRTGFFYQLEFGAEPAPVEGPALAVSGRGGLGFMPAQRFGFLLGAAFSTARGDEPSGTAVEDSTLSFDHRVFLQAEGWPLSVGRWHAGPYAEIGYAWALEDDPLRSRSARGPMAALGAALQLDCTTRLALTLRAGAAWLPSIDDSPPASASYRLSPALTLGVSIY
jgi:hypothetical protein